MNTTAALFKKELHTAKWFLLGGILFFWSFPLLEGIGTYHHSGAFRTDMPTGMALAFGAIFAIITAGGIVCLDMPKGLYEFWRSRPIRLLPYIAAKYITGLAVILFVVTMPILLELHVMRGADSLSMASFQGSVFYIHTSIIVLIYSGAFFTGHVLGNMTETVIISCAGALMVYFVPILVPALESLSFLNLILYNAVAMHTKSEIFFHIIRQFWLFLTVTSAASFILLAGTWFSLKYHIRIRLGLKTLSWCLGIISLVLFSAAAFSVGSNLDCLAKIELPAGPQKALLSRCFDRTGGVIFYGHSESDNYKPCIGRIGEVSSNSYQQEFYRLEASFPTYFAHGSQKIAWSNQTPDKVYYLGAAADSKQGRKVLYQYTFFVIGLDDSTHAAKVLGKMPLGEGNIKKPIAPLELIMLDTGTVYLQMPDEITLIDIGDDTQPRIIAKMMHQNCIGAGTNSLRFTLPSDIALSDQQRQLMIQYACRNSETSCWDGDKYVEAVKDIVRVYQINSISGTEIHLEKIADRKYLPLEKVMDYYPRRVLVNKNNIFVLNNNPSLTVYNLDQTVGTLKKVGHYAAPEGRFYDMFPREDGNIALVGINQIHIVGPSAQKP